MQNDAQSDVALCDTGDLGQREHGTVRDAQRIAVTLLVTQRPGSVELPAIALLLPFRVV